MINLSSTTTIDNVTYRLNIFQNTTINKSIITNAEGIHIGAVIHHHDQFITCVNFNIKNTTNNKPNCPDSLTSILFPFYHFSIN